MHTKIQYQAGLTLGSNFSDFSLDTDLGRSEETLGRSGKTGTQGFACRAL